MCRRSSELKKFKGRKDTANTRVCEIGEKSTAIMIRCGNFGYKECDPEVEKEKSAVGPEGPGGLKITPDGSPSSVSAEEGRGALLN